MGQVLHGSATTTEAIRRAIQHSQESLRALAKRYGINQKTVAKWKKRTAVEDLPTGPKDAHSTVLSIEEEAIIVALRKHTLLPLDDCLYALQVTIPHLTRSSLHRCLPRRGISRLPDVAGDKEPIGMNGGFQVRSNANPNGRDRGAKQPILRLPRGSNGYFQRVITSVPPRTRE
jgi:transposase-like protein